MARKTIASLEAVIADREAKLDEMNDNFKEQLQYIEELKKKNAVLRKDLDQMKSDLITATKKMFRARAVASQMQGFIRAHHSEKVPTGNMEGFYDSTGNYVSRPILMDTYPFMEYDMSGEDDVDDNHNLTNLQESLMRRI